MFKVLLSATLISVVWSGGGYPTYQIFYDDNYGIIDDDTLRSEHSAPIYQTQVDYNDDDDEHFDLIVDDDLDPRRKYEQRAVEVIPARPKYSSKGKKSVSKHGNYEAPKAAEEVKIKKQSYQAAKLTQEEVEVKSIGPDYGSRVPENKPASYKGQKTVKSIPATEKPVLSDGDYSSGIGQADTPKYPSVTEQKTIEAPVELQQKDVDVDFKNPSEDMKIKGGYPVPHITYDNDKKEDSYSGTDGNKAYAVYMKNEDYKKAMRELRNKPPSYSTLGSPRRPNPRPSYNNNPVYREHASSAGPRYNYVGNYNHGPRGSNEHRPYGGGSTLYEGIGSRDSGKPRFVPGPSPHGVSSYNHYPHTRSHSYPDAIQNTRSHSIKNSYQQTSGHNYGSSGSGLPSNYRSLGGHNSRGYLNHGGPPHIEAPHSYSGVKTHNGIGAKLPTEYSNTPKYPSYPESGSSLAAGKARPVRPPVRRYQPKAQEEPTYQGIGESSPSHQKKHISSTKTKPYPVEQKILPSEPPKYPSVKSAAKVDQQKIDNSEINYEGIGDIKSQSAPENHGIGEIKSSIPTYKGSEQVKIDSSPEYSGIGEIKSSSGPPAKGGSKGGKGGVKTADAEYSAQKGPSKYLPVTAAHSSGYKGDSPSDSPANHHSKSYEDKDPSQIEQKELVYEAFLAGQGSQSPGSASGGYGFLPTGSSSGPGSGSGGYGAGDEHENPPPMPYEFNFEVKDDEHGGDQFREEKMDDNGYLTGRYGYKDAEGIYREVEYQADKDGFRAQVKTNEPGTDNQDPADIHFEVERRPQHQY